MKARVVLVALLASPVVPAACGGPPSNTRETETHVSAWGGGTVCYEIFVRSFFDSDGDGIGDLEGLARKLDYVNDGDPATTDDLGATCIWLMPVAESPSYHGYDVTDYYRVDPEYGTNEEFRRLAEEAHRRGIRILVDMVINHTSDMHPHFQEALRDPDSPYREWYRWSDVPGPDNEWGDNNWRRSPVRDEYYYGFFSHRMPDLNWDSPAVREEMKKVASFWLGDMGADGLRLDAVWHLMEGEDGQAGHAPRTHDMLREFGGYVRGAHPGALTVGEVFDPSDAIFSYYPDQLDAYFAFGVSEGILDAVKTGDASGLLASVLRMQAGAPNDRWAPFLRNHDQTRTLTELGGDIERARLAASLLLTLPGIPFVYYGEEIGMTGDKPDPRIRTPMAWAPAPAVGFTAGVPWQTPQADSMTANVAVMESDPGSLLYHYRELVQLRARSPALAAEAGLVPLETGTPAVAAYLRGDGSHFAIVVANLTEERLAGIALSSTSPILPPGRYVARAVLGSASEASLTVSRDGRLDDWSPLPFLEPLQAHVWEISETPAESR